MILRGEKGAGAGPRSISTRSRELFPEPPFVEGKGEGPKKKGKLLLWLDLYLFYYESRYLNFFF